MQLEPEYVNGGASQPARAGDISLRRKAYQYIQAKILSGEYTGGEVLSEQALSREIGVSRTPVREALGKLAGEGFLEHTPGRGTTVKRPTRADVVELFELREALEVYAVGKVARQGLTAAEAAKLADLCSQLESVLSDLESRGDNRLSRKEMERCLAIDLQYHLLFLRAAGNRRIMKLVRDARLLIRILSMPHETHDVEQMRRIHGDHCGILAAVQRGDFGQSVTLLETHIRQSQRERLDEFDRWERISQMRMDESLLGTFFKIERTEDDEL